MRRSFPPGEDVIGVKGEDVNGAKGEDVIGAMPCHLNNMGLIDAAYKGLIRLFEPKKPTRSGTQFFHLSKH
jgi:hypothetical protein